MILLVFIASVVVAVAFGRQERRHGVELAWEYERRGMTVPPARPKLKRTEAFLNVCLGFLILCFGIFLLQAHYRFAAISGAVPGGPGQLSSTELWVQAATYSAAGFALIILGIRALMRIRRFEREAATAG